MIIVKAAAGKFTLPISDEELSRVSKDSYEPFLPYENAVCLSAEMEGSPAWLEISYNRKTARIPLPTDSGEIQEAYQRIGAEGQARPIISLRVPDITLLDRNFIYKIELTELNRLGKEVRKMTSKSGQAIMERDLQNKWPRKQFVTCVSQTLEQIRREESYACNQEIGLDFK